jgi:tetratricopeptide (TPR) repeat protein
MGVTIPREADWYTAGSEYRNPGDLAVIPTRATSRIEALSEGIIEAGWLLALGLVPLLFNIYSSRNYEPDKAALLRSLAVVMVAAWLWKVVCGGRLSRPLPLADGSAANLNRRPVSEAVRALFGVPLAPLVVALALLLVVGSILSVDSRLSWLGSYARAQGTWTQLTYLVVFALVLTHLRTHAQWRRVVFTVIVASTSISLYGVFQELGIDPVTTAITSRRVYSTLGNSIFLGAYLVMVVFLTALEFGTGMVEWSQRRNMTSGPKWWPGRRTVVLGGILLCQLAALVLSQSRGPFLGLLGGAYVFILAGLLRLRRSGENSPWLQRWGSLIRWAVPGIVGAALLTVAILVVVNMPGSPLESVRNVPYVGRLGSVLDAESRTIQVRLYIWRSVSELLQSGEPLESPDGTPDTLSGLRPALGTGPETLGIAVNRFVEPKLGQLEKLTKIPDRSHNEIFDLLVMEGAVGTVIWLGIFCAVCGLALRRLGLIRSRAQTVGFWSALVIGAMLGAVTPWLASGEATLSGVGLSVGLVLSLALFVTVQSLIESTGKEHETGSPMTTWDWLVLALLATFVAHMVEIQVGIAITTTRLYFWFYAAVTVLAARGWLLAESRLSSSGASAMSGGKPSKDKKPGERSTLPSTKPVSRSDARRSVLVYSLIAGSLCIPWVYGMTLSSPEARTLGAILAGSWFGSDMIPTVMHLSALCWLVLVTIFVGLAMSLPAGRGAGGRARPGLGAAVVPAIGLVAVFAVIQAGRVAHVIERTGAPDETLFDAEFVANHFAVLVWGLVFVSLAIGALLGLARGEKLPWTRRNLWRSAVSGLLIAVAAVVVVERYHIDPIRADSLLRVANHLMKRGRAEVGLEILDRSVALSPREPMYQLVRGSAALTAATTAGDVAGRRRLFELSEASLRRAHELAPLDPDHSANLARCLARQASVEEDRRRKTELLEQSGEHYDAAIRLRPKSVVFLNESGRLLLNMGRTNEARNRLECAVELDPLFTEPYIALAAIAERSAAAARSRGDAAALLHRLEEAADIYERALEVQPDLEPAQKGRERVRRAISSQKSSG